MARRKVLRRLMNRLLGGEGKRKILDVGCSHGSNLRMLQDFGTVHAMELDRPAVEYCRTRYPGIRVYDGGIPDPLRDTYDVICLFDVLAQIEDEDGALEWIDDHLAPGGVLLITVPAFDFLWSREDEQAHHLRRYTRAALEGLLRRRFSVAYSSYFNTHLFPVIAAARLTRRWMRRDREDIGKPVGGRGIADGFLQSVFAMERLWLPVFRLPFGVSIFAVAQKAKVA